VASFNPAVVALLALAAFLYVRAVRVLSARGYEVPRVQQAAWYGGLALAAVALLLRDTLRTRWAGSARLPLTPLVFLIAVYSGYFGAAAGVLMLAVLSLTASEPLAVTNAVKNVVCGISNLTAAIIYAVIAPVHWPAALLLGAGCLLGSWIGPAVVRRTPEKPLRIGIAVAALGLAACLWLTSG
jgi:uncharacterized membrane protein YfcA